MSSSLQNGGRCRGKRKWHPASATLFLIQISQFPTQPLANGQPFSFLHASKLIQWLTVVFKTTLPGPLHACRLQPYSKYFWYLAVFRANNSTYSQNILLSNSGKWYRKWCRGGVYMSEIAVCAAQIGVNTHQCRCELTLQAISVHAAQAQWPIRASILFTSDRVPLPVFRSRANLVGQQIRICIVIGCRLSDAEEITHAGSALCCWINGSWRPLDSHFGQFLSGSQTVAALVNST